MPAADQPDPVLATTTQPPAPNEASQSAPSTPERPKGIEHAGVIDFMGFDAAKGQLLMVMVEPRPWHETELQLYQLQEKLNAYLSFLLDGELEETYPQLVGKAVMIRLECAQTPPEGPILEFLQVVHDQTALQSIDFEVVAKESQPHRCECGAPEGSCGAS